MSNSISNCNFTLGKVFDEAVVEGVNDVAKALLNLTELYRASNIYIDCLLKIVDPIKEELPPLKEETKKKIKKVMEDK